VLSQRDVSEVQLAKAAIRAGVETLLAVAGIGAGDVAEVVLAGAFGNHLNLHSVHGIGMLPPTPGASLRQVGNAAGQGAKRLLVSRAERVAAEEIGRTAQHVRLEADPGYRVRLARALAFEP
jgi:uncharacterized 2Fe-2S/4Fe-4S cluster protein (DUF4445 family)